MQKKKLVTISIVCRVLYVVYIGSASRLWGIDKMPTSRKKCESDYYRIFF